MDEKNMMPYTLELMSMMNERESRRKHALIVLLMSALIITNALWLWHESQYVETETTVTQEVEATDGTATINDGVHINGED